MVKFNRRKRTALYTTAQSSLFKVKHMPPEWASEFTQKVNQHANANVSVKQPLKDDNANVPLHFWYKWRDQIFQRSICMKMRTLYFISFVLCLMSCWTYPQSYLSYTLAGHKGATLVFKPIDFAQPVEEIHQTQNQTLRLNEVSPATILPLTNSSSAKHSSTPKQPCPVIPTRGPQGRFFFGSSSTVTSYSFVTSTFNYASVNYCYTWTGVNANKPNYCRRKRSLQENGILYPTAVYQQGFETTRVPEQILRPEPSMSLESSLKDETPSDCELVSHEISREMTDDYHGRALVKGFVLLYTTSSTVTIITTSVTATLTSRILFASSSGTVSTYCIPYEFSASPICT